MGIGKCYKPYRIKMQRYDSYKDSGVKWLGEIPEHWGMLPGMAVLKENKTKNTNLSINTVLSLSYGKIVVKKDINEGLVPAEYNTYQVVRPGNIIIRCTDLQNDKTSLRTGLVENDGIITGAYLGLIVDKEFNPSYIHYFLHSWDITKEIYRHGSGLRQSLSWLDLKRLPILIPSRAEQDAIVTYLDTATAKIDAAIAQQQKMIDLLNERKQIIINKAVTRGLNPNVKMKDSGVEWIGEVPEGWELDKLKLYYSFEKGKNAQIYTNEYVGKNQGEYPVYSGQTENNGVMGLIDSYDYNIDECLFTTTVGAKVMTPRILKGRFSLSQNCLIMTRRREINNEYVYFFLLSMFPHKKALIPSHMQPSLRVEDMRTYKVLVPPIQEQKEIARYLDNQCDRIDRIIEDCDKQINLLQERKQIIINEVVTGKVKVTD